MALGIVFMNAEGQDSGDEEVSEKQQFFQLLDEVRGLISRHDAAEKIKAKTSELLTRENERLN